MQMIGRWLWYLAPANPIVVRIVQGGSQRMRDFWVRIGYLGALIMLVLFGLLGGEGMGSDATITDLAKAGTKVFNLVAQGQVILVCLIAPVFMAGAINQERQGETFDILLTTPLSNLQIVLGSLLSRLYFVLALLLSGLPLFSVLPHLRRGADPRGVRRVHCLGLRGITRGKCGCHHQRSSNRRPQSRVRVHHFDRGVPRGQLCD